MEVRAEHQDGKSVIIIDKDKLLGVEAAEIQDSILTAIDKGSKSIEIDLSTINYVTSWGIGILVHSFTTCTNREVQFALVGVSDKVLNTLTKVKLHTVFDIRH